MTSKTHDLFLSLVRLGIGHAYSTNFTDKVDWEALKGLADQHGLSAIVLDGLNTVQGERLMVQGPMPQMLRLQWIGEVMQSYEQRYVQYEKAIVSLAGWYTQHGYKMMVLKGYACSLDWPNPKHRPCGDIDIWQFGKQKEADAVLAKEKGVKIDTSHHHHTVFEWDGFSVENHYDFTDLHHYKSNAEIERILKNLGQDSTDSLDIYDQTIYVPTPNMHALFLLKHAMAHFAAEGMTLRQIIDWGFYVKVHTNEIDWSWLEGVIDKYGMIPAYNIFNAICVEDLGFDAAIFPNVQFSPMLKDKVLNDILNPEFSSPLPKGLLPRVIYKVKRWSGNTWKHELCYKDSLWSAFWCGVWNHLRKPATI